MRFSATISTVVLLLSLASALLHSSIAFAQSTHQASQASPAASASEKDADFIDDIVAAAEQRGVRIIVIDGPAQLEQQSLSNNKIPDTDDIDTEMSLMTVQTKVLEFRGKLQEQLARSPESVSATTRNIESKSPSGSLDTFLWVFYWSVVLLAFGAWVEHEIYTKRLVAKRLEPALSNAPTGYLEKIPLLFNWATLKALGVVFSIVVAFSTGSMLFRDEPTESIQFTIATLYLGYAVCRFISIIWRVILSPFRSQYRIPSLSDTNARKLYYWLLIVSTINIVVVMIAIWTAELGGTSDFQSTMVISFSGIIALVNIIMVIANRNALSHAILNGKSPAEVSSFQRFVSSIWLSLAIAYFIFSWLETIYRMVLDMEGKIPLIAGAYGVLISIIFVYALINFLIERFFHRKAHYVAFLKDSTGDTEPGNIGASDSGESISEPLETTTILHPLATYEDLARRVAGILSVMVGLWGLTLIWNVEDSALYNATFQLSADIIAILFIGYIAYHTLRIWIDNKIQEEGGDSALAPGDEGGASGASRVATLLPLFRNFMLTVISLSVILTALLELGINVSPLFASAGVVGLAIGFGAQTLVRDIFSGAFYLIDDAFRRGEYVDIGSVKGTVEKISVRSFQLRHHLGPLHTIPFGEIQSLTNYSRDWVMMKLTLRLTYDTDIERVRKLIKKLGISLKDDPIIGHTFLQPLKSQGVIEMQDSAMIVRVKFMCKPGDQWSIRKRVYQEIRDLFHREGIKFAHKEVTVRLAGDVPENLTAQQARAITAAAIPDDEEDAPTSAADDR